MTKRYTVYETDVSNIVYITFTHKAPDHVKAFLRFCF